MGENETRENTPQDLRSMLESAFAGEEEPVPAAEPVAEPAVQEPVQTEVPAEAAVPAEQTPSAPAAENPVPAQQTAAPVQDNSAIAMQLAARAAESMRVLQEENARLRAAVQQQGAQAQQMAQAVVEDKAPKVPVMPVFDSSRMGYMDENARKSYEDQYGQQMAEYIRYQMAEELAPLRENYERQKAQAEREAAIGSLRNSGRMQGFDEALPQIERILEQMPSLAAEQDAQKRYTMGYLINRGLQAVNAPAQRAAADVAKEAMANPEVMRLIEAERARAASEKNAAAVPQSASTGASTAPATPQNRPQNLGEARTLLQKAFGL
jgi:hypothetical protein